VLSAELRQRIVSATPLHRLSTVADVANTARWLASPAAGYITGSSHDDRAVERSSRLVDAERARLK
jgi:NAD(P)-dependent dehydrogenase (short-subunit alcohol dehydrogenase family)